MEKNITNFMAEPEALALGHMDQVHKSTLSKRTTTNIEAGEEDI